MTSETLDFGILFSFERLDTECVVEDRVDANGDRLVSIRYPPISAAAAQPAIRWLWENRSVVTHLTLPGRTLEGVWRTVAIEHKTITDMPPTAGVVVVQRFASGLYDTIVWDACRVLKHLVYNTDGTHVPGINDAASDLFGQWLTVWVPHVNPKKAGDILTGLQNVSVINGLSIGGISYGDGWFFIDAESKLSESGECNLQVVLAKCRYVVKCQLETGTPEGRVRYYIFNVPSMKAQGVLNSWASVVTHGSGMVYSYNPDRQTVHLMLEKPESASLSGYRKTASETAFNIIQENTNTGQSSPSELPAFSPGKIYTIRNEWRDGKYDVTVREDTAKTGETPEYVAQRLADGTVVRVRAARHLPMDNLPSWAQEPTGVPDGAAIRLERQLNEYGGLAVERTVREVTEVRRPSSGAYEYERGPSGKGYVVFFDHVAPADLPDRLKALDGYKDTHWINVDLQFDASTNRYNVRLEAVPTSVGSGGSVDIFEVTWTEFTPQFKDADGVTYVRFLQWQCGLKHTASETSARNFVHGRDNGQITPLAKGGFRASYQHLVSIHPWERDYAWTSPSGRVS